jgi:hypothetical protein
MGDKNLLYRTSHISFPAFDLPLIHDECLSCKKSSAGDSLAHKRFERLVAKRIAANAPQDGLPSGFIAAVDSGELREVPLVDFRGELL